MIEAIVAYIQDKGFDVYVLPRVLMIRKKANGRTWGIDWAIARENLIPVLKEVLFDDADRRMDWIDAAIAKENAQ